MRTLGLNKGVTVWFTGPPASGKTTLAEMVTLAIEDLGIACVRLDAHECRDKLWPELGMSKDDRVMNVRRLAYLCLMLRHCGLVAVVAAISPYEAVRSKVRTLLGEYVEVYCKASKEARIRRDTQGLYRRAEEGKIKGLTGYDAPYEEPQSPELTLDTEKDSPEECVKKILVLLKDMGYLNPSGNSGYSPEEEAEILKRLEQLGYV